MQVYWLWSVLVFFFFSSRRRHTRCSRDWSSDVCSSDLTPPELEEHRGWGHSTFEEAVTLAAEAGVRRLVLFHHEPEHGDAEVEGLLAAARRAAQARGVPAEGLAARGRMVPPLRAQDATPGRPITVH